MIILIIDKRLKPLFNNLIHLDNLCNHPFRRNLAIRQRLNDFFKVTKGIRGAKPG